MFCLSPCFYIVFIILYCILLCIVSRLRCLRDERQVRSVMNQSINKFAWRMSLEMLVILFPAVPLVNEKSRYSIAKNGMIETNHWVPHGNALCHLKYILGRERNWAWRICPLQTQIFNVFHLYPAFPRWRSGQRIYSTHSITPRV